MIGSNVVTHPTSLAYGVRVKRSAALTGDCGTPSAAFEKGVGYGLQS